MLMGEYRHSIDDKGRIFIPAKFRETLKDKFIVTKGLDGCLFAYSFEEWEKVTNKLSHLSFTKKDARQFMRFFLSGAITVELDKQGRINIAIPLKEYAALVKECVIIGVNDRLEIWSKEKWDSFIDINEDSWSDIAENLFDGDHDA